MQEEEKARNRNGWIQHIGENGGKDKTEGRAVRRDNDNQKKKTQAEMMYR